MILVVALLVLLALMGTAYVATVRTDRTSSIQHSSSVQVDLLMQAAIHKVQTEIVSDLFEPDIEGEAGYRRQPLGDSGHYDHYDSPVPTPDDPLDSKVNQRNDNFLADRAPSFLRNRFQWRWISGPLDKDAADPTAIVWEDPRTRVRYPGKRELAEPIAMMQGGMELPGFADFMNVGGTSQPAIAADADGDGIADAGLSQLLPGTWTGLTWYVGHRTIDNAGALNLTTAWEESYELLPGDGSSITGAERQRSDYNRLFPSQINLFAILDRADWGEFNWYRRNSAPSFNLKPVSDDPSETTPIDFMFRDEKEAFWMQLGRRASSPGFNFPGRRYQRFAPVDTFELAESFVVQRRRPSQMASSRLPRTLSNIVPGLPAPTYPYFADEAQLRRDGSPGWGALNFFGSVVNLQRDEFNRRPLLVTANPVTSTVAANYVDKLYDGKTDTTQVDGDGVVRKIDYGVPHPRMLDYFPRFRGMWDGRTQYYPGDVVVCDSVHPSQRRSGLMKRPRTFVCMQTTPPNDIGPIPSTPYWHYETAPRVPSRADLNTSTFAELFRAFWQVMHDGSSSEGTPMDPMEPTRPVRAFRSSLRQTNAIKYELSPPRQLLLRAAIAAVNTIDLRDADDDVTSVDLELLAERGGQSVPVRMTVFGMEKQPFITEVYVNTARQPGAGQPNKRGYVAIELYNPHETPINLRGWRLGIVDRRPTSVGRGFKSPGNLRFHAAIDFEAMYPPLVQLNGGQRVVLENYRESPAEHDAHTRPPLAKVSGNVHYAPLHWVLDAETPNTPGGELVILRPRRGRDAGDSNSSWTSNEIAGNAYDESGGAGDGQFSLVAARAAAEMVPVDQFDFTGLKVGTAGSLAQRIHHRRSNLRTEGRDSAHWKFVYAGQYAADALERGLPMRYEENDVEYLEWNPGDIDSATGEAQKESQVITALGVGDLEGTYDHPFPAIQLNSDGMVGPNRGRQRLKSINLFNAHQNFYPHGGFPRVGDVLFVPFIGAYRMTEVSSGQDQGEALYEFAEMNSVTMDASLAHDGHPGNDQAEAIGRFCPIPASLTTGVRETYDWAEDVLEYFTVFANHADYLPHVDAHPFAAGPANHSKPYPGWHPFHVTTVDQDSGDQSHDVHQGLEGLVNINTAPARVLSAVPWSPEASLNDLIAHAIVRRRNEHRSISGQDPKPFRNLMDLIDLEIPTPAGSIRFYDLIDAGEKGLANGPDDQHGDFTPAIDWDRASAVATDGVRDDFEELYLPLIRVSNLITTRSDSFTSYVCIQGWRDAGDPTRARLEVERRAILLIDRSNVTAANRTPRMIVLPGE